MYYFLQNVWLKRVEACRGAAKEQGLIFGQVGKWANHDMQDAMHTNMESMQVGLILTLLMVI